MEKDYIKIDKKLLFDYTFYDNGKLVAVLNTNYIKMILGVEELLLDETEHR